MSYRLVEFSPSLQLSDFYSESDKRGLKNNNSQAAMFDCFRNEKSWTGWLIEYQKKYIGGVCIHSFEDIMGENSYRIYARACFHTELSAKPTGYMSSHFKQLQNVGLQLFTPVSIAWAGLDKNFYGSSNSRDVGSSRTVNETWFPRLADKGIFTKVCEVKYRGHYQNIWQLNVDEYIKQIQKVAHWNCEFPDIDIRKGSI